jgi:RNA polymerase sigma-70 factor (ECF subfamily)
MMRAKSKAFISFTSNQMSVVADTTRELTQALVQHRTDLLRYAKLQLRNDAWAEDAVSEVCIAALEKPQSFEGRSQIKTWLIGILKFKILDKFRQNAREVALPESDSESDSDALEGLLFKTDGHFATPPSDWGSPEAGLNQKEFFIVLETCMEKLPAQLGRLFLMREWLELSSEEICKELALTSTNFYVQLHRARLRLRECLEINWFGKSPHAI